MNEPETYAELARIGRQALGDLTKARARIAELETEVKLLAATRSATEETVTLRVENAVLHDRINTALVEAGEESHFDAKPHKAFAALVYVRRALSSYPLGEGQTQQGDER